jgi:hypothetical protein
MNDNESSWEYRICKRNDEDEEWFEIAEVYYLSEDDYKNDKPSTWTTNGARPGGNSLEEIKRDLEMMMEACNRPIFDEEEKLKEQKWNT